MKRVQHYSSVITTLAQKKASRFSTIFWAIGFVLALLPSAQLSAQFAQQGSRLLCTGNLGGANLGRAIALSADGNTAIVGGVRDNTDKGAVWIFTRSGTTWSQQQKLIGSGAVASPSGYIYQGTSVDISADGNTVIFGASADNNYVGAAWIFTRSGSTWTQQGNKLVASNYIGTSPTQGYSVSLSADGNTAMVGAHADNSYTGAAWIYTRSGTTWSQQQKLVGTGGSASAQGNSVALSGDGNTAIMGGPDDNNYQGAVWVFTRSGSIWTQQGSKLVGTGGVDNQGWGVAQGTSLAMSNDGNTFIVGGEYDNDTRGAAWVFTRSGTTWMQQGSKLSGTDVTGYPSQGISVSLSGDGNVAIVGGFADNSSKGAAWVYTRSGSTWSQQGNKLVGTGSAANANQGRGVAISADGTTAMVGGSLDNTGGVYHGAVWAFIPAACTTPTAYSLTGGGSFCSGGTGVAVGLSNSQTGINYQLKRDGSNVGSPVAGSTGNPVAFGNQSTAGAYTVVATNTVGSCTADMTGSVNVTVNTAPSITSAASSNSPINTGATLNLTVTAAGTAPLTYAWLGTGTFTNGTTATPSVTGAATGNYVVAISNSCGTVTSTAAVTVTNPCPSGTTLHVNASVSGGTGDGTSWANAYASLGDALAKAHTCSNIKSIKVAAGTYKPTKKPFEAGVEMTTADARDIVFHIPDGVTIEGGYDAATGNRLPSFGGAGGGSILSGDFNGDDVVTGSGATLSITNNTENAYHVVLAAAASSGGVGVTIDGFTITGGNANISSGIIVNGNIVYRYYGGGIATSYGTNTISNNTLSGNAGSYGGGITITHGTNTISNNTLSGNYAVNNGGGIHTNFGTNTLSNNTLSGNYAVNKCGGIYTNFGTNTLSNNTLSGNYAVTSGGIYTRNGTNTLSNNTLSGNAASSYGGGIYTEDGTNTLSNNTLSGNNAGNLGGGLVLDYGTNTASNNTFFNNSAVNGGGIYSYAGYQTITNNIFWDNKKGTANNVAGADYYAEGTNGNTFKNNLLQLAESNYTDANSNVLGAAATGNVFAQDPLFVNAADPDGADNIHRTADDGLALQSSSPCINTGITGVDIPTTDITGATRIGNPDMGAYEAPVCTTPTAYSLNGGGSYCTGGTGVAVGLANSETGVNYQLKKDGTDDGTAQSGTTGAAINFGTKTAAGTYTVVATRTTGGCTANMTGSVVVSITPTVTPSVIITANPGYSISFGTSVTFTATPTNGGTTPSYQWKKNNINIGTNSATYIDAALLNGDVIACVLTPSIEVCAAPTIATSSDITMSVCNCSPICSSLPTTSGTYTATVANIVGAYTHYCDGAGKLLLSLKVPSGTTIPTAAVKVQVGASEATYYSRYCGGTDNATSCFMGAVDGNALINRYWFINATLVTGTAISPTQSLQVVSYFTTAEYDALNNELTGNNITILPNMNSLRLYMPKTAYGFGEFPDPSMIKPFSGTISIWNNSANPGNTFWQLVLPAPQPGINAAEFKVTNIKNTGGLGKF